MPATLYMDVHMPKAVTNQLRRRGVDVLTAFEDGSQLLQDSGEILHKFEKMPACRRRSFHRIARSEIRMREEAEQQISKRGGKQRAVDNV